jgi:DNA-binding response OmpR family regulator
MQKILIIEDDKFIQGMMYKKFQADGFEVLTALNSVEAFNTLNQSQVPDLIVLDLLLPGVDGFEILKNLSENESFKKIPVLVFSNLSEAKDVKRAVSLGAKDFLVKANFTLDELVARVKDLLSQSPK